MLTFFRRASLVIALFFSAVTFAQDNIAVVDLERAMNATNIAQGAIKQLEASPNFKANIDAYNKYKQELTALGNEEKANGLTWSSEQQQKHQAKMEAKFKELNQVGAKLEAEKAAVEKQVQQQLAPKLKVAVEQLVEEKKIGLLLNARTVYYKTEAFDLTEELVDRLNKVE